MDNENYLSLKHDKVQGSDKGRTYMVGLSKRCNISAGCLFMGEWSFFST